MAKPRGPLPPFAALRAFHAAATHDTYREAAESLGITESAISHQLRKLEGLLHTNLFDRSGTRTKLTPVGRRYLEQIEPAIRQIQAATEAILPAQGRSAVRLTLPPSLAATWLIPRLSAFERRHPEIDLQLITTTRVMDLKRDQVDLAIRHGKGTWPGIEAEFLLEESAMPVCAPGYLVAPNGKPTAELLRGVRFIVSSLYPDEWTEWAGAHGLTPLSIEGAISLETAEQILRVAELGHGLAMGRRPLVDDRLASGKLIAPFGGPNPTGAAYYLCRPRDLTPSAAARRTALWLKEVAAAWHAADPQRPQAANT